MDLSKLKIDAYDLLAVIVPGLLFICEVWITVRGWSSFSHAVITLNATALLLMILVAFAVGSVIQEAADTAIKKLTEERYFKRGRDKLWASPTGATVMARISKELGCAVESVDVAFDFCLTRVHSEFAKRDLFLAQSDFARSLVLISVVSSAPLVRIALMLGLGIYRKVTIIGIGVAILGLTCSPEISPCEM